MLVILFIALGLAMDAFAVAVTSGLALEQLRFRAALKIALFFGGFQALMPLCGWLAGLGLSKFISGFDHWVAFGLLGFIGCKMIYEALRATPRRATDPLNLYTLLGLSIATSIDALAVGLSFALLEIPIVTPAIVIGSVTFLLAFLGVFLGHRLGRLFQRKAELLGGLILIGIGLKILLEHLA
ncbi:MAG: manganese efflux pump MntP [Candidatus Bipolaricaulia bacterium]